MSTFKGDQYLRYDVNIWREETFFQLYSAYMCLAHVNPEHSSGYKEFVRLNNHYVLWWFHSEYSVWVNKIALKYLLGFWSVSLHIVLWASMY